MNINTCIELIGNVKHPTVANNGYSLDVYSPKDIFLKPNSHIEMDAGFKLILPENVIGIFAPKTYLNEQFIITSGQIVHPNCQKQLLITLKYLGLSEEFIKKDSPLLQIILVNGLKLTDE